MTMAKIPLFSSQKNMAGREASREDGNLNGIEEGVKNSFRWVWLEE